MAVRTRSLTRLRSPLLMPPNTDMTRSRASLSGSMGPPISGTQKFDAVVGEQRHRETELVAVEGAVGFADEAQPGDHGHVGVAAPLNWGVVKNLSRDVLVGQRTDA